MKKVTRSNTKDTPKGSTSLLDYVLSPLPPKMAKKGKGEGQEPEMEGLVERVGKLEEEFALLKNENVELKQRVKELMQALEESRDTFKRDITATIKDTLSREGDSYVDKLKKNLNLPVGPIITIKDVTEIQDRRLNLVFRGVKELESSDLNAQRTHDQNEVLRIAEIAGLERSQVEKSLLSTRRLGTPKRQNADSTDVSQNW